MTTSKAIAALREKLGATQQEFAEKLKSNGATISRYENGKREPGRVVLKKLSMLAESAVGLDYLRDFFDAQTRAAIITRVKKSASAGSERHVSLRDLKYASAYLRKTANQITNYCKDWDGKPNNPSWEEVQSHLKHAEWVMRHIRDQFEVYIAEPWSSKRMQEDEEVVEAHWRSFQKQSELPVKAEAEKHAAKRK